jgi:hypothetical protein
MAPAARDSSRFDTRRAKASRRSGEWTDDDYDVLADGALVGRCLKLTRRRLGGRLCRLAASGCRNGPPSNFCRAAMAKAPQLTGCINMFRVFLLAAAAVALAGCARSESAAEGAFRADDAKCKSYGPTQAPTPMWTAAWP